MVATITASAMKIETDKTDDFTGERIVITSWESFAKGAIHIRLRLDGNNQYLDFKYVTNASIVIPNEGKLLFKSATDEITTFNSTAIFTGAKGAGATGLAGSAAWGIHAIYKGEISWFESNIPILMRLYQTDGYEDKKLGEKDGKKLQQLADLFISTVTK